MDIQGLQKLTLLDFPGKVACTVFLGGCDFRCPFCHNGELLSGTLPAEMTMDSLLTFLQKRRGLLDGVAITGGEPTLYRDLPELLTAIRSLGFAAKLDTNGNHPDMLQCILEAGLVDYVAMDIKNSPEKYAATIGLCRFDVSPISRSMQLLRDSGIDYELRTTVVQEFHDDASFLGIGPWIQGTAHYYLQCFTDRDTVLQAGLHAPSVADLQRYADLVRPYVQNVSLRGISAPEVT